MGGWWVGGGVGGLVFFFFQAEDGIRDDLVTGVQTCALPIWSRLRRHDKGVRPTYDIGLISGGQIEALKGAVAQDGQGVDGDA